MYFLELEDLSKDDLNEIYSQLYNYGLINKTYIMRNFDRSDIDTYDYPYHFANIKLTEDNIDDMIDLIIDLGFEERNIIVDLSEIGHQKELEFHRYMKLMSFSYNVRGGRGFDNINLDREDSENSNIVSELLNHEDWDGTGKFDFTDFMVRFNVRRGGKVYNELGEYVGMLGRKGVFKIFTNITGDHSKLISSRVEESLEIKNKYGLSTKLSAPWYYLGENINLYDILDYKKRVFDIIKNADVAQISTFDDSIKKVLFESRYLPLGLIEKIENRNHRLFEKEWFINQVKEGSE